MPKLGSGPTTQDATCTMLALRRLKLYWDARITRNEQRGGTLLSSTIILRGPHARPAERLPGTPSSNATFLFFWRIGRRRSSSKLPPTVFRRLTIPRIWDPHENSSNPFGRESNRTYMHCDLSFQIRIDLEWLRSGLRICLCTMITVFSGENCSTLTTISTLAHLALSYKDVYCTAPYLESPRHCPVPMRKLHIYGMMPG
mmetsp:Transcript_26784/g.64263  ORF Transcript_26784/g.64263 Transcript_26784/m.64263 type:complete len:200 (-) Transcript_26784:274-873(-)